MNTPSEPESELREARRPGFLGRFLRDRSGSTAIEFVILAIPFSMLVFAILESCISFAGQEVLANAADDVARQVRTGQLRAATITKESIQQAICNKLAVMVGNSCNDRIFIDLRKYDTFQEAAAARFKIINNAIVLTKDNVKDPLGYTISPGPAMSINMLRVFYKWPVMTDFVSTWAAKLDGPNTLHFATVTWQNEPFDE
ncbi:MAG TPA: TadE/TadG family type IV pilus assembly protein [Mesorhizobium sp.]